MGFSPPSRFVREDGARDLCDCGNVARDDALVVPVTPSSSITENDGRVACRAFSLVFRSS